MGNTEAEPLAGIPCRSIRGDPPPTNPVIFSSGVADTMTVAMIDYAAQRTRYDTEECILKALEDGEIELFYRDRLGDRSYDTYRLTAKGRKACDEHINWVVERSKEATRRDEARRQKRQAEPCAAAPAAQRAAVPARPEPFAPI